MKRGEVQDFGIRTGQGLMLAVALVMDGVTAMCQLPLRVADEFKQPNRLSKQNRLFSSHATS